MTVATSKDKLSFCTFQSGFQPCQTGVLYLEAPGPVFQHMIKFMVMSRHGAHRPGSDCWYSHKMTMA